MDSTEKEGGGDIEKQVVGNSRKSDRVRYAKQVCSVGEFCGMEPSKITQGWNRQGKKSEKKMREERSLWINGMSFCC